MAKHDHDQALLAHSNKTGGASGLPHTRVAAERDAAEARAALRRAEERYARLLDNVSDGVVSVDRDWRILRMNGRAEQMLGRVHPGNPLGQKLWLELPAEQGGAFERRCRQAMEYRQSAAFAWRDGPGERRLDVRLQADEDGLTMYVRAAAASAAGERGSEERGSEEPLREQVRRAHAALRDESNILELLNSTGTALAGMLDLDGLLHQAADAAIRISGARCGAFYYAGDGAARHVLSGPDAHLLQQCGPACAAAAATLRLDDAAADPRGAMLPAPLRSLLAVPVLSRSGASVGALLLGHPKPGAFDARSERIVGGVAAQAAVAIDNTRLYELARRAADERKLLLDSERSARAEAERTNQMKDEFLATLSHELRTPLSAILGWAQVLRRGTRDQADLHRGLQSIERNARAQAQLIEDLLDMSRITSGKVLLDIQPVAPKAVIEAAIETLRPAADAKNIRLDVEVDASAAGTAIAGDPSRLQQVIWNLLSNALKFTPRDGFVRIGVRAADASLEIAVSDSGVGIRPEFLGHVFERFRQGDASTTRKHGGLGLGLAIVKHLVEQHGGAVRAASAGEGRGATFTVQLPLASAPRADAPTPSPLPAAASGCGAALPDLSGLTLLVVDDDADARELIERILSDCHASVRTAASAVEALRLFERERPDLLLSDIGMPDIDGFELLAMVRALGPARGGALPAIALTAFARSEDRQRALERGFLAHVSKPVEPAQLIATVAGLVRRRGAAAQHAARAAD
ncbi:MAG TPA: histidine kinase [Janthinobacterium sp.]|nr:histidine kinase [Janthinobacterium sp.]